MNIPYIVATYVDHTNSLPVSMPGCCPQPEFLPNFTASFIFLKSLFSLGLVGRVPLTFMEMAVCGLLLPQWMAVIHPLKYGQY